MAQVGHVPFDRYGFFRESRNGTDLSVSSINGELSKTVTSHLAAAQNRALYPPPEAKQSIFKPPAAGNHSRGSRYSGCSG